jgi:hypothetical protein
VNKQYPSTTLSLPHSILGHGLTSLSAIELAPPSARPLVAQTAAQTAQPESTKPGVPEVERGFPFWAVWIALAAVGVSFYMPVVNHFVSEAAATLCGR